MKITRYLLVRQLTTLYQIQTICQQTDVRECDKCPYDKILCGVGKQWPHTWDLEALLTKINEWEDDKHV